MGSKAIQGELWGQQHKNWAEIQEKTGQAGYEYALNFLELKPGKKLLDVGCGSGLFSSLASDAGAEVTGIDASEKLIEEAKLRASSVDFLTGEMEELPFDTETFDFVCGFNSFQYAANVKNALEESKRVLQKGGKIVVMIWGNKDDCEAASYLKAVGSLLPPPPQGAPGPFALSENNLLENMLEDTGFRIIDNVDVLSIWDYTDKETALKGLISAGPVARAIQSNGFDKVYETLSEAVDPYIKSDGHVVYHNKFRVIIAEK